MKLSEYIGDLQACLELYGDGPVFEEQPGTPIARTAVRSPRLRVIVSRNAADTFVRVEERTGPQDPRQRCYVI